MSLSLGEGSFALLSLLLLLTKLLFDMSNLLLRQSTDDRGECKTGFECDKVILCK